MSSEVILRVLLVDRVPARAALLAQALRSAGASVLIDSMLIDEGVARMRRAFVPHVVACFDAPPIDGDPVLAGAAAVRMDGLAPHADQWPPQLEEIFVNHCVAAGRTRVATEQDGCALGFGSWYLMRHMAFAGTWRVQVSTSTARGSFVLCDGAVHAEDRAGAMDLLRNLDGAVVNARRLAGRTPGPIGSLRQVAAGLGETPSGVRARPRASSRPPMAAAPERLPMRYIA